MSGDRREPAIQQDNDFKYMMQDTSTVYLGARFSYEELLQQEMVPFKLKSIISQYILKDVDPATTLESHFYYLTSDTFAYQTYRELKVKIKVCVPEEKRSLTGRTSLKYEDRLYKLKEFEQLNLAQKKKLGILVREIAFPKLSLMSFTV